jgi:hypothetical protein
MATPEDQRPSPPLREIKRDKPYCWQSKAALRKIRDAFDDEKTVASAIAVYCALTEIASDKASEKFQTTHGWLGQKSGLSPRTVQNRLVILESIELLKVTTPLLKAPSTYQLLSVPQPLPNDTQPLPNDTQPLPNDTQPLPNDTQRTKKAPLPTLEESQKKELKKGEEAEPPKFQPVKLGLYRREYDAMVKDAQEAIRKVKADAKSYAKDLTKAADDLIEYLTKEKPEGWEARIECVMQKPESFERKNLKPKPAAIVQAWRDRIEEIKRAMAGIKPEP